MARSKVQSFNAQSAGPVQLAAGANSWHAFANVAVASALVVAVVVGTLTLVEAVLVNPTQQVARLPSVKAAQVSRQSARQVLPAFERCARRHRAPCETE